MNIKKFTITTLIYAIIFGGLNILLSTYFVVKMENFIQEGLLDDIAVVYESNGTMKYRVNESYVTPYEKYGEALRLGDDGIILFAKNGLALKRTNLLGKQYYVIDFDWLPSGKYDEKEITQYVTENRAIMLGRSSYLSDSVIFGTVMFAVFYGISFYIIPTILLGLSKLYIWLKSRKKEQVNYEYSELAGSMLLKLLHKRWERSWEPQVMLGFLSYIVSSTNMANTAIVTEDSLSWVSLLYVVLLIIICLYYLQDVYTNIDLKRLERKMMEEDI